jgi:hypothetical protein
MTRDEALERVAKIAAMAGDDEAAHGEEDSLHRDVLRAIADGTAYPSAAALARCALGTIGLDFARWTA